MNVYCLYCHMPAELVNGIAVYPHRPDLATKMFYQCKPCDALVGCHPGTIKPLGRLANAELRLWKRNAHTVFDRKWKHNGMTRGDAYQWLSDQLDIPTDDCHIGMFDVETCKRVVDVCRPMTKEGEV